MVKSRGRAISEEAVVIVLVRGGDGDYVVVGRGEMVRFWMYFEGRVDRIFDGRAIFIVDTMRYLVGIL